MKIYIVRFTMPLTRDLVRAEIEAETETGAREAFQLLHPAALVYDVYLKKTNWGKDQ